MIGFSISGHSSETVTSSVEAVIIASVLIDGLRPDQCICRASQPHAPMTAMTERAMSHQRI